MVASDYIAIFIHQYTCISRIDPIVSVYVTQKKGKHISLTSETVGHDWTIL